MNVKISKLPQTSKKCLKIRLSISAKAHFTPQKIYKTTPQKWSEEYF
jgi:hypothetical protein